MDTAIGELRKLITAAGGLEKVGRLVDAIIDIPPALVRIAAALEESRDRAVTLEQLEHFAGGKGQAFALWNVLIGAELGTYLDTHDLPAVRGERGINVAALKKFVDSHHCHRGCVRGLNLASLNLLRSWAASL